MSISIATLKEAIQIKETIEQLEARLSRIFGSEPAAAEIPDESAPVKRGRGRRRMSAAARAKISAAMKSRWAEKAGARGTPAASKGRRRKLSPEGRARIVAALKARWARQRKGAQSTPVKTRKARRKLSPEGRARIVSALKARWAAYKKANK